MIVDIIVIHAVVLFEASSCFGAFAILKMHGNNLSSFCHCLGQRSAWIKLIKSNI